MNAPQRQDQFISFDNSYAQLPDKFYTRLAPTPVRAPKLIKLNRNLAERLGIDPDRLATPEGVEVLAGNQLPAGADPIAMAYAGHQFGTWVPQLGDGRAILLGEVADRNGTKYDIQLKGAGRTPYSRMGDGRAAVGPVLREYIVSEAMAALGVPTTRALAAVVTGEGVMRESVLPGAILARVAQSHIRVGTFQYFAARQDHEALGQLADHVIARHYPDLAAADQPYHALLDAVMDRQANLIAKWMQIGFIHGVMNTDNMSVSGETIDYGPCAFMDTYHPDTVFSSIDHMGRYSFNNQPRIARWNLARFAQCLLPIMGDDAEASLAHAQHLIDTFQERYQPVWLSGMRKKLGLTEEADDDLELVEGLLQLMADSRADFTLTFRALCDVSASDDGSEEAFKLQCGQSEGTDTWLASWHRRLAAENSQDEPRRDGMRRVNPRYIPRNHLVEHAISAAMDDDFQPFEDLVAVLSSPFDDQPGKEDFASPPGPDQIVHQTFCGT